MQVPANNMEMKKDTTWHSRVIFCIALFLFAYTAIRAYLLSITWDEAYTYIEFARNGKVLLDKYEMMSANNHILNTAMMIVFTKMFGVSEFVMRMPVLITHFLFLFYSAKLVKNISYGWLAVAAFVIVNVNPYMLDFFSVARGYGLSLGLMMASIYYFYLFHVKENKNRTAVISVVFAMLAVLANFVMLNYCVVLFGLIALLSLNDTLKFQGKKLLFFLKRMVVPFVLILLLFLFVVPIAVKLKAAGALFFGGENNFWADTICTITNRCFYELGYNFWFERMAKGFVFLILMAAIIFVLQKGWRKKMNGNILFLGSLLLLLGLCSLSTIVQHYFMGTAYLVDRTALFLLVLFNLIFVFFIAEAIKEKKITGLLIYFSAIALSLHFAFCFNLRYVLEWRYDENTKEMMSDLDKIKSIPEGKETVSIGIPLIFDPAINFYRDVKKLSWLNTVWRKETSSLLNDYFCLGKRDLALFNKDSIEIIKTYPGTENVLAKPKYAPKKIRPILTQQQDFRDQPEGSFYVGPELEYAPGFSIVVNDTLLGNKKAVVAFYADLMAPDLAHDNFIIVLSFQDAKANLYSWQKAYVKDFPKSTTEWFRASFTCIVPQEVKAGDEIKAYIWNADKHKLYIKQLEFKWLGYEY